MSDFPPFLTCRIINNAEANEAQHFASNQVITSKYTWWNFLFIFLYENLNPFNKFANFYFVCVAICEVRSFPVSKRSAFLPFPSQMASPSPYRHSPSCFS